MSRAPRPRPERPVVALVTDAIYPFHRGGKEMRYHEIARRLSRRADVHVYTMRWWEGRDVRRDGGVTYHAIMPKLALYTGERRSIVQALAFAVACLRLVFERFDVIEADHMPYVQLFPLRLVALVRRRRLVVTWHEVWGPDYWRTYLGRPGRVGWWFERTAMRLPHHVIAASAETAERLSAWVGPGTQLTVAPNGVDLDAIRASPPAPQRSDLVVVGRLLEHKRVDMLVDAIALLRAAGSDVTLRVIGDGPERARLQRQVAAAGVQDLVELRTDVGRQDELYSLVKAARVFVFPSAREGFGIAVLEALACGLPVVATSAPDNIARHLVERSARGIVCAPDAASLAAAIIQALDRAEIPAVADGWLAEFDWDAVTGRVAEAMLA